MLARSTAIILALISACLVLVLDPGGEIGGTGEGGKRIISGATFKGVGKWKLVDDDELTSAPLGAGTSKVESFAVPSVVPAIEDLEASDGRPITTS